MRYRSRNSEGQTFFVHRARRGWPSTCGRAARSPAHRHGAGVSAGLPSVVPPRTSRLLRDGGVSKHVLDGPRYRRTSPGRYVPADVALTVAQRLVEASAHLPPGGALGGWSAAHLLGAVRFDGVDSRLRPLPVVMCVPDPLHRGVAPGI